MKLIKTGEKDDMIILKNEEGATARFFFLEMIPYNGRDYAVIADENDEAYIFGYSEGPGGQEIYTEITDDALYDALADIFEAGD